MKFSFTFIQRFFIKKKKPKMDQRGITEEELSSLKEAFTLYDTNKNGALLLKDFAIILESLQIETDPKKIDAIVNKVDRNHDGRIDFDEFVTAMNIFMTTRKQNTTEQLRRWNTYPDPPPAPTKKGHRRNYSHSIMSRRETDELRLCFARFDKNGDGLISAEELKQVMIDLGENLTDQEIADMMKDGDANSDGFIDFKEFKALMPN